MCFMETKHLTLFPTHISLVSWDMNSDTFGSFAKEDGRSMNEFDLAR